MRYAFSAAVFATTGLMVLAGSCNQSDDPTSSLTSASSSAPQPAQAQPAQARNDLASLDPFNYDLDSAAAQRLAGGPTIAVRVAEPQLEDSTASVPVPTLASIDADGAAAQLVTIHRSLTRGAPAPELQALDEHTLSVQATSWGMWMDTRSGTFSAWRRQRTAAPELAPVIDAPSAVDVALRHFAQHQLLSLAQGESVDVLRVSAVNAAMVDRETHTRQHVLIDGEPRLQYRASYVVTLGRRYRGAAVLGSRIRVELGRQGQLLAVERHWRPITAEGRGPQDVLTDANIITERFQQRASRMGLTSAGPVEILTTSCGYLEAPLGTTQSTLRPVCQARVRLADSAEHADRRITVDLVP